MNLLGCRCVLALHQALHGELISEVITLRSTLHFYEVLLEQKQQIHSSSWLEKTNRGKLVSETHGNRSFLWCMWITPHSQLLFFHTCEIGFGVRWKAAQTYAGCVSCVDGVQFFHWIYPVQFKKSTLGDHTDSIDVFSEGKQQNCKMKSHFVRSEEI